MESACGSKYQLFTKSFVDCADLLNSKRKPVTRNNSLNIVTDRSEALNFHQLKVPRRTNRQAVQSVVGKL